MFLETGRLFSAVCGTAAQLQHRLVAVLPELFTLQRKQTTPTEVPTPHGRQSPCQFTARCAGTVTTMGGPAPRRTCHTHHGRGERAQGAPRAPTASHPRHFAMKGFPQRETIPRQYAVYRLKSHNDWIGEWLLEGTHGLRGCQKESRDRSQGTGQPLPTGSVSQEQPGCKLREKNRATPAASCGLVWSLLMGELADSRALTRPPGSPGTRGRRHSSGLGLQRDFRCQILISSPNTTVGEAFATTGEAPSSKPDLLRGSTTCSDAY